MFSMQGEEKTYTGYLCIIVGGEIFSDKEIPKYQEKIYFTTATKHLYIIISQLWPEEKKI